MTGNVGFLSDAVTDLAAQLEQVIRQLDEKLDLATLRHLEARLKAIETSVGEIGKRLPTTSGPVTDAAEASGRGRWDTLPADQARRRWQALRAWVEWLVVRNDIGPKELPSCWYRHGGLVDELEALYWAWTDLYRPDGRGTEPLAWREALHRARDRWTRFNPNGCANAHSETLPKVIADQHLWAEFLVEELAGRSK